MTKKIIILAVLLLNLVSCYKEVKKDYKNLVPYIEVEKTKEEVFKNITIKDYINKLEYGNKILHLIMKKSDLVEIKKNKTEKE